MQYLIPVSLLGWIPITLALFVALPTTRAVTVGIVGAWLILPTASIPISGLPDYDKSMAATVGICLATLILQPNRLLGFRPRWFDVMPMAWCLCPFISSLQNGLGLYDGLSSLLTASVRWGLPYFIGRLYLNTLEDFRDFAIGMVIGGMIYVLPTLYEIRMSPVLRSYVYGLGGKWSGMRFGGYRPFVFLTNGLEHGMWMTVVSLLAVWLWRSRTLRRIGPVPMGSVALPGLLVVTVLCRSLGALILLLSGLAMLWACTRFRSKLLIYLLLLVAPTYYAARIPGLWSGDELVSIIGTYLSEERAESLGFRFSCENKLIARALLQPLWGWAGWGRNRVIGPDGRDLAPTDGLWIIHFGQYGYAGLICWTTTALLPTWLFLRRFQVDQWTDPRIAPAAAMAVMLGLYQVDCLVNAFLNLPLLTAAGGLISLSPGIRPRRSVSQELSEFAQESTWETEIPGESLAADIDAASSPPRDPLVERYVELARSLRAKGQTQEARQSLIYAQQLATKSALDYPGNAAIQKQRWDCANDLAWFLILEGGDSQPGDSNWAVQLATQATEADPDCAVYWNTLGAALLFAGEAEGSLSALEHAIALNSGGTAFDFLFMALAQARLGHEEPARNWHLQARAAMSSSRACSRDLSHLEKRVEAELLSRFGATGAIS